MLVFLRKHIYQQLNSYSLILFNHNVQPGKKYIFFTDTKSRVLTDINRTLTSGN